MPSDMSLAYFASLTAFAFVVSATPGPNVMMQVASGVNFGFIRTIPHMLGICLGLASLLAVVGAGLGAVILASPAIALTLKIASVGYMLWLAWRIASATDTAGGTSDRARPMSFAEAALFQWINPKAWAIALTAASTYTVPDRYISSLGAIIIVFSALSIPVCAAWTGFGVVLRGVLEDPWRRRVFNVTMALLLVASLWPMVTGG